MFSLSLSVVVLTSNYQCTLTPKGVKNGVIDAAEEEEEEEEEEEKEF